MAKTSGQLERERRLKQSEIVILDYSTCYYCNSTGLDERIKFCPNCRFPQRGTQIEMKLFFNAVRKKKQLLADKKKSINKARYLLYILAGLNLIVGIVLSVTEDSGIVYLIGGLISAGIYLGLGIWSDKKPFAAILSGLFVYIVFNVINAIDDPHTIYKGLLLKLIIISGFIYGYKGVKDSESLEKELSALKESKDLSESNAV